jgi:aspartokinase/homoserine dehydrogenase 1
MKRSASTPASPPAPGAAPPERGTPPGVHKFGGASLADGPSMRQAVTILRAQSGPKVAVVSAMSGVTDGLLSIAAKALAGDQEGVAAGIEALSDRHTAAARFLLPAGTLRRAFLAELAAELEELAALAKGLAILNELTPRSSDTVVSRGERLSARLFAASLATTGVRAEYVDARELIKTDGRHGNAFPDLTATDESVARRLPPMLAEGIVPVVPGFLGATPEGRIATLGRGGTDLTATLLGRSLDAARICLWKDVPGLLTANPKVVTDARVIPQLNAREAAELAYYGAKVLHPRSLIPLAGRSKVPLFIRPFQDPEAPGTEISTERTLLHYPVKAVSAIREQAIVTVSGKGMLGVPGIAARTFAALEREGISVSLISQASSEHSICLTVPESDALRAQASLREAFKPELARREIDNVTVRHAVTTIAVVGLGVPGTPGVGSQVFTALAEAKINVIAIALGSSELNLSLVVSRDHADAALRAVHDSFKLAKIGGGAAARGKRIDVVLLGFGWIGRELAGLIAKRRGEQPVRIVAAIDRKGYVFSPDGLSPAALRRHVQAKWDGLSLADVPGGRESDPEEAIEEIAGHALTNPVLVDVTAHETMGLLEQGLASGMNLVLANKRPLSGPKAKASGLREAAAAAGRKLLFEATVGAGLPVMDTFRKLQESGDKVERIEGCLSGTLGFLLTEINRGQPFSAALEKAMKLGYTEPDPRDDLSGLDVGRKALILGRLLGFTGELADVTIESMVPEEARDLPLAEFLGRLAEFDTHFADRAEAARERGAQLRYVARVTRRKISVGLFEAPPASPFAGLSGTDNQVVFTTARYKSNPLVITGPGAGPAVTAAGVLNNILELAGA